MYQKWLEAFHYVAQERSFTAAANVLNVGQPTVSAHVGRLEGHFGVELFHRKGRTIDLTPAGETLYAITHDVFGHEQEAIAFLKTMRNLSAGELRFSAVRPYDVMELLVALKTKRPNVTCSVRLKASEEIISDLLGFRADIGVVSRKTDNERIRSVFYKRHKIFVVVHRDHPLADRGQIRMAELNGDKMIARMTSSTTQDAFDHAAKAAGISVETVFEIEGREGVREAVIRGLGIGVLSETVYAPHPEMRPLTVVDADMHTEAHVVCLAVRRNRPQIREVLGLVEGLMDGPPVKSAGGGARGHRRRN